MSKLTTVAAAIGMLGIVGGVAGAQLLSHPAAKPAQVQLVQPAAQTVTPSPTTTTVAPSVTATPVKIVKAATAPAPVQSTQAVAPAPAPIHQAVAVSTDTSTSSPTPAQTTPGEIAPPRAPAIPPGQPTSGGGVYGGGAPSPSDTKTP